MDEFEIKNNDLVKKAIEEEIEKYKEKITQLDEEEKEKKYALVQLYVSSNVKKEFAGTFYDEKMVEESEAAFSEKKKEYEMWIENYMKQKDVLKEELDLLKYWLSTKETL